jgi:hypothetical protein
MWRGRHLAGGAFGERRQEAHPVFAAYMDMRYSRNMARARRAEHPDLWA